MIKANFGFQKERSKHMLPKKLQSRTFLFSPVGQTTNLCLTKTKFALHTCVGEFVINVTQCSKVLAIKHCIPLVILGMNLHSGRTNY